MEETTTTQDDEIGAASTLVNDALLDTCISPRLRELAALLCEAQSLDVPTDKVLFLYDKTPYRKGPMSRVIKLQKVARELTYQTTGYFFSVAVILKKQATDQLCEAQLSNELYHCLRHIVVNPKTNEPEVEHRHDVEGWREQVEFADGEYSYTNDAPNLFDTRIFPGATVEDEGDTVNDRNAQNGRTEAA